MSDSAMRTIVPLGTVEFSPQMIKHVQEMLEVIPGSHLEKTLVTCEKFDDDKFTFVLRLILNRGKESIAKNDPADNSCTVQELWQEICWDQKLEDTAANYEAWNFNLYAAFNTVYKIDTPH